jgi:hypothetical protein
MAATLTYRREGDYLVPDLSEEAEVPQAPGKYALLREKYLKGHRRALYLNLLTEGTLDTHLKEIEQTATERMELLTTQMALQAGVDEQMKATDQMRWVGLMNNIRQCAEEAVVKDLIYG